MREASVSTTVLLQCQILRKISFRLHHEQNRVLEAQIIVGLLGGWQNLGNKLWWPLFLSSLCWHWPQEGYSAPGLGPRPSKSYLQILSLPYEYQVFITFSILSMIFSWSHPPFNASCAIMAEPSAIHAALSNLLQLRRPGCGACPPKTPGTPMNCLSRDCRSRM